MAEQIKKNHEKMMKLREEGKHEEALKMATDDCIFMGPLHGPSSAKQMLELRKSGNVAKLDKSEIKQTTDDIKVIGDVGIQRGSMTIKAESGETAGNFLQVWVKQGGDWKLSSVCMCFRIENK